MATVKLWCGVYGKGSMFSIKIRRSADVEELRKAICDEQQYHAFPPRAMTLYLARNNDGAWLNNDSSVLDFLVAGKSDEYKKMRQPSQLDDDELFGEEFHPGRNEIHILVELPSPVRKPRRHRGMSAEVSCEKFLDALAWRLFVRYDFDCYCQAPTMGDVLRAVEDLLKWRQGLHEEDTAWSSAQARIIHSAALNSAVRQLEHALQTTDSEHHSGPAILRDWGAATGTACDGDQSKNQEQVAAPTETESRYILFFDGGSWGNPGPGGAGAVIIATDACAVSARLVWSASMSYASNTTYNQAEYHGVVAGLAEAQAQSWTPLEVVGDSMLILRQLANYVPPKNSTLLTLYAAARRSADKLGVVKWHHHLRVYNKMADSMANVAMDSRTSIQMRHPTTRLEHNQLQRLLLGDFQHWQVGASERLVSTW